MFLLSNRYDGREFRIDTQKNAITDTNLHFQVDSPEVPHTIHGIGYSTLTFGTDVKKSPRVTYFIEPDANDSEVWLIDDSSGVELTLRYGDKSVLLRRSLALRLSGNHIEEIPLGTANEKLSSTRQQWQSYLSRGLEQMGIRGAANPLLLREFVWDAYQVAVMAHTDHIPTPAGMLRLRDANMGAGYTFLGLDVHGRDTLQMVPAISKFDPKLAREVLLNMARYTDTQGRVIHRRLLSGQPMDKGHSDESYWFVLALSEYLRNTHDRSILAEGVPYLENKLSSEYVLFKDPDWVRRYNAKTIDPARFTAETPNILDHMRRTLEDVRFGQHGLPLMEDGDWNDALNHVQKGESVMNAGLYAYCLLKMQDLWRELGKANVDALLGPGSFDSNLRDFAERYAKMKKAVNENAWDGHWYVRGFDNRGLPFGSHTNREGKIYLNAQSWMILAGIPDGQQTQTIIDAVERYLIKDSKVSVMAPAYTTPDDNIGNITRLPLGSNENGGQWRQCTLWWIHAMQKVGRQEEAIGLFDELLLANADLSKLGTEPYLYNEYVRGPEAADPGSSGGQAHVQQAALVLADLTELYPQVQIRGKFATIYDFPGVKSEDKLYSITATGEAVPWTPNWVENPSEYNLKLLVKESTL